MTPRCCAEQALTTQALPQVHLLHLAFICKSQTTLSSLTWEKMLTEGYWAAQWVIRKAGEPGWEQAGARQGAQLDLSGDNVLGPATPGQTLLDSQSLQPSPEALQVRSPREKGPIGQG